MRADVRDPGRAERADRVHCGAPGDLDIGDLLARRVRREAALEAVPQPLRAVAAGDADLAARRLVEHYAQTAKLIFAAIDPEHDLARLRTTMATVAPGSEGALTLDA